MPLVISPQSHYDRTPYDERVIALLSQQNYVSIVGNYSLFRAKSPLHMTDSELNSVIEQIRSTLITMEVSEAFLYMRNNLSNYQKLCFVEGKRRALPLVQTVLRFLRGATISPEVARHRNAIINSSVDLMYTSGNIYTRSPRQVVVSRTNPIGNASLAEELSESLRRLQESSNASISSTELSQLIVDDAPERN